MIKDLPLDARPRERLLQSGPAALSSIELIAILLGMGTRGKSVLEVASELLRQFGSVEALADASISELSQISGIGPAKATTLLAAFALAKRINPSSNKRPVLHAKDAFVELFPLFDGVQIEAAAVLLLDAKRKLIHKELFSRGTLTQVFMHPREIFSLAIKHRAHSLIVAHNHPSGDPTPSEKDLLLTKQLIEVGKLVGIPLIDHLIVVKTGYRSLLE